MLHRNFENMAPLLTQNRRMEASVPVKLRKMLNKLNEKSKYKFL